MRKKDTSKRNMSSIYSLDINKKAQSAAFWKGFSVFALLLAIICFIGMLYFASKQPSRAYVVEVNTTTGIASYKNDGITLLENYAPSETSTLATLSTFIKYLREVSKDEGVQRDYINKAYSMITGSAVNFVENYYKETSPMTRLKSEHTKINVYNAHRVANSSNNTYQFSFNERVFSNEDGSLISENNYLMSMQIVFYAPRTERDRETNPLGIWIKDISLSRIKGGQIE